MSPEAMDAFTVGGLGAGLMLLVFIVFLCIASLFLHIGTGLAGVRQRSFGKAILATVVCNIIAAVINFLLPVIGVLVAIFVCPLLIMPIYSTTYGKALIAYLLSFVIAIAASVVLVLVLAGMGMAAGAAGAG
ncbi:MAG: hypothetical protein ACOCXJ_06055 [Planctomycetota bacterium]